MNYIPITKDTLIDTLNIYEASYKDIIELGSTEYARLSMERDLAKVYTLVSKAYEGMGTKKIMSRL